MVDMDMDMNMNADIDIDRNIGRDISPRGLMGGTFKTSQA